ncbi:glycosyltransferase family 4 protein [Methanococcus sp. CF]
MKILYDHQTFTNQKYGGISRYFYELITEFENMAGITTKTSIMFSNNHYISNSLNMPHNKFLPKYEFRGKSQLMTPLNKVCSIKDIQKQDFDIFHPTYYDTYFLKHLKNKPYVLTVHDMIHEKFKEIFLKIDKTTKNKRILVQNATKIIAISENTKKDLMELYGVDGSKIDVVYHGSSMVPETAVKKMNNLPQKYILYVGSRWKYKNFDVFLKAISPLLVKETDLYLLCIGGGGFSSQELKLLGECNIKNKVFQYNLNDEMLMECYTNAALFVFPSLYEGFGIPILESFACKCPLVCSNTSSFPEVAGNSAVYFDPYDPKSILDAVERVYYNKELRTKMVKNGEERLKYFSWSNTATCTKKVYESIINNTY